MDFPKQKYCLRAFSLVELSIVIVILGLLVGFVMSGRDLVKSAEVRAQLAQLTNFTVAANSFREKYNYLPGDIPDPTAMSLNYQCMWISQAGNGNGRLDFTDYERGERQNFWVELAQAGFIGGNYQWLLCAPADTDASLFVPRAALGKNTYVLAYSGGVGNDCTTPAVQSRDDGTTSFSVASIDTGAYSQWGIDAHPTLTVANAYLIDSKVDDGKPQTGKVTATYPRYFAGGCRIIAWVGANQIGPAFTNNYQPYTTATPGSASTCYDNDNTAGVDQKYSMNQSNGEGTNCAISYRFQ